MKRVHGDQFLPNSVLKLEEQVKNESIQLKTEANIQENMKTELIENSEVGQTKESFDEISNQRTMQKYLIYNSIAFQMQEEMKLKVALTNLAMMKSLGYMN